MPLVSNGQIVSDRYRSIADDAELPPDGALLLSAARFLASADSLRGHDGPIGVIWPQDRNIAELVPYLAQLATVVLLFPTFRDGRAHSQARLLRERYGFRGELRASGQVLRDQFVFLLRNGFDSFDVKKDSDAEAFAAAASRYSVFYQPAADQALGALQRRRQLRGQAQGGQP